MATRQTTQTEIQDPNDPMVILSSSLSQGAVEDTNEAAIRMADSSKSLNSIDELDMRLFNQATPEQRAKLHALDLQDMADRERARAKRPEVLQSGTANPGKLESGTNNPGTLENPESKGQTRPASMRSSYDAGQVYAGLTNPGRGAIGEVVDDTGTPTPANKPTPAESGVLITNQSIENLYDRIAGTKYVGTFPAGSKVTAKTKNIVTKTLPDGSVELYAQQPKILTNTPPQVVAQSMYDSAANPRVTAFDVDAEVMKIHKMTDPGEKQAAIITLNSNISSNITQLRQKIATQAAIESGYAAAKAAVDKISQLENMPSPTWGGLSFAQRFGRPSEQLQQAQAFASTTRLHMDAVEKDLMLRDPAIAKFNNAKDSIMKIEAVNANRQLRQDERNQERAAAVSSSEIANWKFLHGDMDDMTASQQILGAKKGGKNAADVEAIQMSPESAPKLMLHPDPAVRAKAFDLLLKHDLSNNPDYADKDSTKTPITDRIRDFIKNPTRLFEASLSANIGDPKEIQAAKTRWEAGNPKEKAEIQFGFMSELLHRYIQAQYIANTRDMNSWKADDTNPDTPLGKIIKQVAQSSTRTDPATKKSTTSANMNVVIERYITDNTLLGPDNKPIPYEDRLATLQRAMTGNMGKQFKSILYPDMSGLQIQMSNEIANVAARAFVRTKNYAQPISMEMSPGFSYLSRPIKAVP